VRSGTTSLGVLMGLLAQVAPDSSGEAEPTTPAAGSTPAADSDDGLEASASTRRTNGASARPIPEPTAAGEEPDGIQAARLVEELLRERPEARAALLVWALTRPLGILVDPGQPAEQSRALFDEWLLGACVERAFADLGLDDGAAMVGVGLTRVLLAHEHALAVDAGQGPRRVLERLLSDGDVRDFLGVNRYRDVLWFSQERFEALVAGLLATAITLVTATLPAEAPPTTKPRTDGSDLAATYLLARSLRDAEGQSGYQLDRLLRLLPG
jgi:hypothetical protein